MPGSPSDLRIAVTGGVITPRSSAITGKDPKRVACGDERRGARAALPGPRGGHVGVGGHRPVGREGAEVVDPHEVEELEDPPEPGDPPRVALAPRRGPVVHRVAPELPVGGERVRRDARHEAGLEQLGVGAFVGGVGRDVDRDVADQTHAAVGGIPAQRRPFAVEAHLVVQGRLARERDPVLDPVGGLLAEQPALVVGDGRVRIGQQRGRSGERGVRLVRRAVFVGRRQRQHLPPRLAGRGEPVDPRVGLRTEASGRQ